MKMKLRKIIKKNSRICNIITPSVRRRSNTHLEYAKKKERKRGKKKTLKNDFDSPIVVIYQTRIVEIHLFTGSQQILIFNTSWYDANVFQRGRMCIYSYITLICEDIVVSNSHGL